MDVLNTIRNAIQYLSEGVNRVFRPDDSSYPKTGVQPFDGEPFSQRVELTNDKPSNKG